MAEIVVALVKPAIEELGKVIVAPIKRQFNYLCCFNSNIQSLRKEAKKLEDARDGLQSRVNAAEDNVEVILPQVVSWLKSSDEIRVDINGIETVIPNVKREFWNMKSRFLLSRKAKKATEVMKELRDECNFNLISQPAPPPARGPITIGETYEFETRKQIEEDIMEALRGAEVNLLGICGMGGVGKTTMANRIMKRAREEDLFDEILMVVVSQSVDMFKIQREISELLGLELKEESLQARAHKLGARLMGTKRALVVLDDVWKILKLKELGIPCESGVKGCTLLLTSRDRDVFIEMDVKKVCALRILPEEEAWFLFREKVGTCVDDQDLVSIAKEVAKECKGLPIALVTVGRALKDEKTKLIWKDALQQLKGSNPLNIPHFLAEVYNPLKLSYDFLNDQQKTVFLFCSLFPEDDDISLDHLAWYFLGLGIFKGIKNLEETRNRVYTLVKLLKSRFLLIDGNDEHYVIMHDVVRDVAIFVASQEGLVDPNFSSIDWSLKHSYSDCTWISMFPQKKIELPIVLNVPRLRLLLIHYSHESKIQMHDQFFEAIKDLNVLSFRYISFKSLPQTIQLLKNLLTLRLELCTDLESISIVGELSSLEILICRLCRSITELPAEIGRLTRLRLLDVSYCESLKRVAPGILSSLVRLDELKMIGSFKGWEAEKNGKERRNASLNELQSLSNLKCLEIEIDDWALASEEICLSSKIVKYDITFNLRDPPSHFENRGMSFKWPREIRLGNWIHIFLSTECLHLEGNGSNSLDLAQGQNIKTFNFSGCSTVNKVVSTKSIDWRFGVFPVLESLWLNNLPNLVEICDGPIEAGSNSFNNLKKLEIDDLPALMYLWNSENQNVSLSNLTFINIEGCDKLRNLFPLNMAKDGLLQLKELTIEHCKMIEEVFSSINDGESHITFPKLEKLILYDLPSLTTLCKGIESIECPVLTEMVIRHCPKLTSFVSSTRNCSSLARHNDDSSHLFCNQKVTFGSLKILTIDGCENISNLWCHQISHTGFFSKLEELWINSCGSIRSLFSSSIAANLVNLKKLEIRFCNEMVKVIGDDEENVYENSQLIFPSLERLTLQYLPNLVIFCGWRSALQLRSLTDIEISECPRMESFTMGSLTTPSVATCSGNNPSVAGHSDDSFHLFCDQKAVNTAGAILSPMAESILAAEINAAAGVLLSPSATGAVSSSIAAAGNQSAVAFGSLKRLSIGCYENISNLWCHQILSTDFFRKLEELNIKYCDSIRCLFSSSIAADLVNLKKLRIYACNKMVKVIGDDDENVYEHSPEGLCRAAMYALLVNEELESWPENATVKEVGRVFLKDSA
ncbi:hypothetical protein BUALT_Bualt12G0027400 [Buddleja alternifolia]|uniref:AAA+ ATPase domain-containing protein n=1 Tax=Buddleja alternifolia TaxID=168488 RepID=A0AAV6WVC9_9LAMI|nr:hypothetical protein BUALT_Bualt12G0027400 [Buddleja alternifolia]